MRHILPLSLVLMALLTAPLRAQFSDYTWDPTVVEVDVELALMVDVSRSMTPNELEIQRHGYAAALTSDEVLGVIEQGFLGRIAVTYVEWAGPGSHRIVVDWTTIATLADAEVVAAALMKGRPVGMQRTSISSALDFAADTIEGNGYQGLRRVIDVSGDGPNNSGAPVVPARDRALARGIVINGLPLMTDEGVGVRWTIEDLDAYYRDCVVGGQGAFVIPVASWEEFPRAVRQKILMEIASAQPVIQRARVIPAAGSDTGSYDCLVGEKTWERFRQGWEP